MIRSNEITSLIEFLKRYPLEDKADAEYVAREVEKAAICHDRYLSDGEKLRDYQSRRRRLMALSALAKDFDRNLKSLDLLSRDELELLIEPEKLLSLRDLLGSLAEASGKIAKKVQTRGKPQNLPRNMWLDDMADIFENAFRKEAKISGSDESPRGPFFDFLQAGRPSKFPRYGYLSGKHIRERLQARAKQRNYPLVPALKKPRKKKPVLNLPENVRSEIEILLRAIKDAFPASNP